MRYHLDIYRSDNKSDLWAEFKGPLAFLSIRAGDFIAPATFDPEATEATRALVIRVEHEFWVTDFGPGHRISVFTTPVRP